MNNLHITRTIDAYNKNARKYFEKFESYEVYVRKISDFQRKYIKNGSNILDLGCGPGNNIKTILKNSPSCNFTGIDLSETFINIAKKSFPQFDFYKQDLRNINLKSQYDVILASFCIVHLTDGETEELLNQLSYLIKNNGYIYLSYMSGEGGGYESTSFSEEEIYFNYYKDQFILGILENNSLEAVEISKEQYIEQNGSVTIDTFIYLKKQDK